MDIKRLKKLAGMQILTEDFTTSPEINTEITNYLRTLSPETRGAASEALEILYLTRQGLTAKDWVQKVRDMWPDSSVKDIIVAAIKHFMKLKIIQKDGNNYIWVNNVDFTAPKATDDENDPQVANAVRGQVNMAYDAKDILRNKGEISLDEWATSLARRHNISPELASRYIIQQLIPSYRNIIVAAGPNRFRYVEERHTNNDSMDLFRSLVRKQ